MADRRAIIRAAKASAPSGRPTMAPQGAQPYFGSMSPAVMQNQVDNGYAYAYGNYLPRPSRDFTQGAFGPFSPILPVPVDTPTESGRAEPRSTQFEVGWNLPVGEPGTEGIKLATFPTLRTLADLYSVARACIQTRKMEIRGLEWDIMPTSDAAKANKGDQKWFRDFGERRAIALKFFRRPDPDYFRWNTFIDAFLEEVFVFDALSLYLRPKRGRNMGKGLFGSDLDSLNLISGPTIRPLYDIHGSYPRPPAPAYQQYLYGVPRSDFMQMVTDADIDEAGMSDSLWSQFRGDQLLYLPMTPRRWTPYGFPPIERALIPVMSGLQKQGYALDFFREGTVPAVYISPGDTAMTPNQIRELQDALNAFAGDPAFHHKIIVLPAGAKVMPQRDAQLADQFDEVIMNQVCCVPGTEIVTKRGLVEIENVVVGDEVLTHRGRWQAVTKTMTNPVHETVRRVTAQGLEPLEVTGNHPVWAARYSVQKPNRQRYEETRWTAARDLTGRHSHRDFDALTLPVPVPGSVDAMLRLSDVVHGWDGHHVYEKNGLLYHDRTDVQPLPAEVPLNAAFGRLFGFFLAEGNVGGAQLRWYFHKNEIAYQQQVVEDLQTVFGITAKVRVDDTGNGAYVWCTNVLLAELLTVGKQVVRRLPAWAWDGSEEFYASMLQCWINGDGTRRENSWDGATTSKTLAWQMRLIAIACGYEASIIKCAQSTSDFGRPGYVVADPKPIYRVRAHFNKSPSRRGIYRLDGEVLTSPVQTNETSTYEGDVVYNLEVEGDNSYVTTGGTVHNCMAFDVMPMELGISPKVSTTMSPGASNQMAKMTQSAVERKSTKPLLSFISEIMNGVLQTICGQDDLEFVFEGLREEEDEEQLTTLIVQQVNNGLLSIDEGRDKLNLQPWGLPETSGPIYMSPQLGPVPIGSDTQKALIASATAANQPPAPGEPGPNGEEPPPEGGPGEPTPKPKPAGGGAAKPKEQGAPDTPGHAQAESQDAKSGEDAQNGGLASGARESGEKAKPTKPTETAEPAKKSSETSTKFTVPAHLEKAVNAELEALSRHLKKGREISTWAPKNVPPRTLAVISEHLAKGVGVDGAVQVAKATTLQPAAPPAPPQAQPVPAPPPTQSVDWAGWAKDAALAGIYAKLIHDSFHRGFADVAELGAGVLNGSVAVTRQVLKGLLNAALASHLGPVLNGLWHEAWFLGDRAAAAAATKTAVDWGHWTLGKPATAPLGDTAHQFEKTVLGRGLEVASGIADTRLDAVAQAIRTATSPEDLAGQLDKLLDVSNRAAMIAQTEATRMSSFAAMNRYGIAGVTKIEWNTEPGACTVCQVNAAQDPIPVGDVFKSGAPCPPQHPHCRCSIEPMAFAGDLTKLQDGTVRRQVMLNGQETWFDPYAAGGGGQSPVRHWGDGTQAPDGVEVTGGVPGNSAGGDYPRWDTPVANGYQGGLHDLSEPRNPAQAPQSGNDANQPFNTDRWPSGQTQTYPPDGGAIGGGPIGNEGDPTRGAWGVATKAATLDKAAVHYRPSTDSAHRCGTCVMFHAGTCDLVKGHIDPQDVCDRWLSRGAQKAATALIAAGIAVLARNTGRVLMLQRSIEDDDQTDLAAGQWEFPGGKLEAGETPLDAAKREWQEETGCSLPPGTLTGRWDSSNGVYRGFVWTIADEGDVPIGEGRGEVSNPDDPDGDKFEAVAWWDPAHLTDNPAVRGELQDDLDEVLDALGAVSKATTSQLDGPAATPQAVRTVMLKNFPATALAWVNDVTWRGPMSVPLSEIDFSGENTWAADHEEDHVDSFMNKIKSGEHLNPIILIDTPGQHDLMIVDGHHRALAYRALGEAPLCYVGTVTKPSGPWDETHSYQLHQGAADANKFVGKVGPKGYVHGWIKVNDSGLAKDKDDNIVGMVLGGGNKWSFAHKNGHSGSDYASRDEAIKALQEAHVAGDKAPEPIDENKAEAERTFNSVRDTRELGLTYDEQLAISGYTGDKYSRINNYLRTGNDGTGEGKRLSEQIHSAFDKADGVPNTTVVHRGVYFADSPNSFSDVGSKIGSSYTDKGFVSTSTKEGIARGFTSGSEGHGAIAHVYLPTDTKVLKPSGASAVSSENELLLDHGQTYNVVGDTVNSHGERHVYLVVHGSNDDANQAAIQQAQQDASDARSWS